MRYVTYERRGQPSYGVVVNDRVVDLPAARRAAGESNVPADLVEYIAAGEALHRRAASAVPGAGESAPLSEVRLLAPIPRPRKNVFCLGLNYAEHAAESARAAGQPLKLPEYPIFFTKPATAVIGPDAPIVVDPKVSDQIDWEVEFAVVIGKRGRDIPAERADDYVFGYTIVNDVSARDLQRRHGGQFFKGKALDATCPIGPWIVSKDEIGEVSNLTLETRVNGERKQHSTTKELIFDVPATIQSLSEGLTLEPGDIIATGTPSGVGMAMQPPQYLKPGDVVEVEIERIGVLRNPVGAPQG